MLKIEEPASHQSFPTWWRHTLPWIGMWHSFTKEPSGFEQRGAGPQSHVIFGSTLASCNLVLGSQMRERIYSEDHKTQNASNFWCMVSVPKLIVNYILLCSPSSSLSKDWYF